jgi:membrane-associated phospholipid phosphatase
MLEAAALSTGAGFLLKEALGRERPYVSGDATAWRAGGDSFPSLHATAAFAIGGILAESGNDRYRWIRRVVGYGIGAVTSYRRLEHDAHWLSDVVASAGLGVATARFVIKRRDDSPNGGFSVSPSPSGIVLSYVVDFRR